MFYKTLCRMSIYFFLMFYAALPVATASGAEPAPDAPHSKDASSGKTPAIGVVRFQCKGADPAKAKRKFAKHVSEHLFELLSGDLPAYRFVPPSNIKKKFNISSDIDLNGQLVASSLAPRLKPLKKHNIRLLILGHSDLDGLDDLKSKTRRRSAYIDTTVFIFDVQERRLAMKVHAPFLLYQADYRKSKDDSMVAAAKFVRDQVIEKSRTVIDQIMKR